MHKNGGDKLPNGERYLGATKTSKLLVAAERKTAHRVAQALWNWSIIIKLTTLGSKKKTQHLADRKHHDQKDINMEAPNYTDILQ